MKKKQFIGLTQVFFDFESTDLYAKMGVILCGSFLDSFGNMTTIRMPEGTDILDDRALCVQLRDELEKYDIIYGWNSKEHDVRFLNGRLIFWGERPLDPKIKHVDIMWQFNKMKVGGRSLEKAANFFELSERKKLLELSTWKAANVGREQAIQELVERCESDVRLTREVFGRIKSLLRNVTS